MDALLLSSVDTQALLPGLQKAASAGIILITLQTGLSDQTGLAPFYSINTENRMGGRLACQALIQVLAASDTANEKTPAPPIKLYIQKGQPSLLDPEARVQGCEEAIAQTGDIQLAAIDSHGDDPLKANQQVLAILASTPGLSGIVCTDLVCAQAASQALANQGLTGKIKIVAFDATPEAVNLLRQGSLDFLVTPKPFAMGYVAVTMVTAALEGVTGLPSSLATGWEILTPQNLADPAISRWVYDPQSIDPQRSTAGLKIAFVAGINDPFYYTMQRGAQQAATSMGAELLSQYPTNWSAAEQAQMIESLASQNDLDALLLVPTDPLALLPTLQTVSAAGIPILALDTTLGSSFTPLSTFDSDDQDGGYFACRSLAQAIGGRGKIYIQSVTAGIATTDQRERGCQRALSEFPEIMLAAVNYNDDDPGKAQAQLTTILANHPDLAGVFCTNVLGAQAVGQYLGSQGRSGQVKVAAFDATSATQDLLRNGVIDLVVAQKPAEMGYLGMLWAAAWLDGVTDLPAQVSTGFVLLTRENMDDPAYARYFYTK
jgi:ribose transport system substrate-binding protein